MTQAKHDNRLLDQADSFSWVLIVVPWLTTASITLGVESA